jgi:hypothetical protein
MKNYKHKFLSAFNFYLKVRKEFNFCGTSVADMRYKIFYDKTGVDAKECFFNLENGINKPTKHPNIVNAVLLSKASINFNIKQWADGMKDSYPLLQSVEDFWNEKDIVWDKDATFRYESLADKGFPDWVFNSLKQQFNKKYLQNKAVV